MSRAEAVDAQLDIGLVVPVRTDLKADGDGFSLLVPVEQFHRIIRTYKALIGEARLTRELSQFAIAPTF